MCSILTKIENFLKSEESDGEKNVILGNCNPFQRKLIYQVVQKDFKDEVTATSQTINNQKVIVIEWKWSDARKLKECEQQNEEDESEYRRLVGLSALLLKISQSKKPIVGHNVFMDLYYLLRQFFEPLADSLQKFKKQAHKIFPNIFDTKHICNQKFRTEINNSTLGMIFEAVAQAPFKLPNIEPESPEYGYDKVKEHEAGYDSYMTGVCFVAFARKLNVKNEDISSKSPQLRPLLNKIFMMRLTDIFYIDLTGTEPQPDRQHVFHASFPDTWTQNDVVNQFRKFGPVQIRWIDNKSAFVALVHRENAAIVLKSIDKRKGVKVITHSAFAKINKTSDQDNIVDDETESSMGQKRTSTEPANQRPTKLPKTTTDTKETEFVKDDAWPED